MSSLIFTKSTNTNRCFVTIHVIHEWAYAVRTFLREVLLAGTLQWEVSYSNGLRSPFVRLCVTRKYLGNYKRGRAMVTKKLE